jgi:hypothetical protein
MLHMRELFVKRPRISIEALDDDTLLFMMDR